jgi:hypothetical protein
VVKSDQGGEYYSRHTPYRQLLSPFVKCLQEHDIVVQYSLSYESQQNSIAERHICTLMDMMCNSMLLVSLWMEALKTTTHIINRVISNSILMTPYKLWTGRKPSINYLHMWGCPGEAKIFNP